MAADDTAEVPREGSIRGVRPFWQPDDSTSVCTSCALKFTISRRKHHCRACGFIFCGKCAKQKAPLPKIGYDTPVLVCNPCVESSTRIGASPFEDFEVFATADNIAFVPRDTSGACPPLLIGRHSHSIQAAPTWRANRDDESFRAFGCIGLMTLFTSVVTVLITDRVHVGSFLGCDVFEVKNVRTVVLSQTSKAPKQKHSDGVPESIERQVMLLFASGFYFSYDVDLTRCIQRQEELPTRGSAAADWFSRDSRFFWNEALASPFLTAGVPSWTVALVQGYFCEKEVDVAGRPHRFTVVSRRSKMRAGTRYNRRGVDEEGGVGNNVETEQVISTLDDDGVTLFASFVQVRGSIPVFWSQTPLNNEYRPKAKLDRPALESLEACAKHMSSLSMTYGRPIHCLNLVHDHGHEAIVGDAFEEVLEQMFSSGSVEGTHTRWDFHAVCANNQFANTAQLRDLKTADLKAVGYCLAHARPGRWDIVRIQCGVFRTNCMDCLDRTNVVQSMMAKAILETQLLDFSSGRYDDTSEFEITRKEMWANNGDAVSQQYAGTSALKGDFTRTGKRNLKGMANDGMNSLSRYYSQMFTDKHKQAAIDLSLEYKTPAEVLADCRDTPPRALHKSGSQDTPPSPPA